VEIRGAQPRDFAALAELTVRAYEALFDEPLGDYERELRDVAAHAADSVVLVAVSDRDEVLGGVTYVPGPERAMSEFDDVDAAGIRMLAVDPRHQGEGAGRALLEECIGLARAAGRTRIVLHSTIYMTAAQSLYRSVGFERAPANDVAITDEPYSQDEPFLLVAFVLAL
jgi:ribosomal protein S18 acetylase RimI-like enzyme